MDFTLLMSASGFLLTIISTAITVYSCVEATRTRGKNAGKKTEKDERFG